MINPVNYKNPAIQTELDRLLATPGINISDGKNPQLLEDVQSNILNHNKRDHLEYIFLYFHKDKKNDVKSWIANELAPKITSAWTQLSSKGKPDLLNFSLTFEGYKYLGFRDFQIPESDSFRKGILEQIHFETSAEEETYLKHPPHAVLLLATDNGTIPPVGNTTVPLQNTLLGGIEGSLVKSLARLLRSVDVKVETGIGLPKKTNPLPPGLQFEDGISNAVFFPGAFQSFLKKHKSYTEADLPPMNTVLINDKMGNSPLSCGSYGAFLKFEFDVEAMLQQLLKLKTMLSPRYENYYNQQIASQPNAPSFAKWLHDLAIAHVIGRFPDGTPLTLAMQEKDLKVNNFDFKEFIKKDTANEVQNDEEGARCPFHTHTRKVNPRLKDENYLKIARRGAFYHHKPDEDTDEFGLLFLSYQNDLAAQFEHIVNNFMLNPSSRISTDANGTRFVQSGVDILFSKPGDIYRIPTVWNGDPQRDVIDFGITKQMIKYRGGVYFFSPSVSFLKRIDLFP
jgi:deferrochelatase/peroxidase EfeB